MGIALEAGNEDVEGEVGIPDTEEYRGDCLHIPEVVGRVIVVNTCINALLSVERERL